MQAQNYLLLVTACSVFLFLRRSEAGCGTPFHKPFLSPESKRSNRIVHGYDAKPHSHPWQALIYVTIDYNINKCGGTLIHWKKKNSSDLILTAAHCVIDMDQLLKSESNSDKVSYHLARFVDGSRKANVPVVSPNDVEVYLGVHNAGDKEKMREKRAVTAIKIKTFQQFARDDDIALLKLDRKVEYNEYIQGICLPAANEDLRLQENRCFVTGWGDLGTGKNGKQAHELQQFEVFMHDGHVRHNDYNKKTMLCSRTSGRAGPAQGDSGGPLACTKGDNRFVLYGIMSFSIDVFCFRGLEEFSIYTRVPKYMDWLKQKIERLNKRA